jgi:hypothetical protein
MSRFAIASGVCFVVGFSIPVVTGLGEMTGAISDRVGVWLLSVSLALLVAAALLFCVYLLKKQRP